MTIFVVVGQITVGAICSIILIAVLEMVRETVRATRQSCRVARYLYGKQWRSRLSNGQFRRYFLRQVWHNWAGGEFKIGAVVFPADPSKPFRRDWSD